MSSKKPVIVYGANGFSGRLVVEYLREYNVPFIAAGRSKARIEDVLSRVPGIETAEHEIVETDGSVDSLTKLFSGAKVVCNTVGPFLYHGPRVVEASLKAGCHYMDIGGEQAWHRTAEENWSEKFAAKGLLLAPGMAYMSAASDIAAHICMETPGIDSLEVLSMFNGIPTFGSTQTIFAAIPTDAYYLEQNKYMPWPRAVAHEAAVPGLILTQLALPWGGFPHPVWYKNHPQIANVRTLGGLLNRQIMETVFATEKHYEENIRPLPKAEQEKKLAEMASSVQGSTPPRENARMQRTIDVVYGRGTTASAQCIMIGTCCYQQTGLMQAYGAYLLLRTAPRKVGYSSPCAAFGHRELLAVLESHGLNRAKIG